MLLNGLFIKELSHSINDKDFYYKVLTCGGDQFIKKYSKEEHRIIQYEKECYKRRKFDSLPKYR